MVLLLSFANGRLMRQLRYGFGTLEMLSAKVTRICRRVGVVLVRTLRGLVRRVGNELVLPRGRVVGHLTGLLLVVGRGRLGLGVYLGRLTKAGLVEVGVRRLIRVGRDAAEGRLLKLVGVLESQFGVSSQIRDGVRAQS